MGFGVDSNSCSASKGLQGGESFFKDYETEMSKNTVCQLSI